jgi:hypothetical protein
MTTEHLTGGALLASLAAAHQATPAPFDVDNPPVEATAWALVERNGSTGERWISLHHDAPAAVAYQRNPDTDHAGWVVVDLVDLGTGDHFPAQDHPAWTADDHEFARRVAAGEPLTPARDVAALTRLVNTPVSTTATRAAAARTRQLLDTYPGAPGIAESAEAAPWLLVEDNTHPAGDPSRWISGHATAAEAVAYHRNQESANDWTVVELVDVENGQHWVGESHHAWSRGIDFPALLDRLVDAASRGNADQTAGLLHQALLTYGEAVTTVEETTQALAGAESAAAARDLYTLLAQPAPLNFPGPLVDLSAVGANKLVPIPAAPAAGRLRDLIEQAQAALTYADGERYAALVEEIVARYAAHETDPGPSRDQLTDMLDAVDEEEGPARIGEQDYPAGWHDAVDAVRNLIDRYPDGLRTPHPDAGQPFRGRDGKIMDGFVVGICGHRVPGMEWRAGMTTCERDSKDEFRQPAAAGA